MKRHDNSQRTFDITVETVDGAERSTEVAPMKFERFEATGRNYAPQVSISENGYMNFNAGACRRFHLLEYSHIVLYFDPECHMIGFGLTKDENETGARSLQNRDPSAGLYAKAFLDFYNIDRSERRTYEPHFDEEHNLLVIGPVPVVDVKGPGEGECEVRAVRDDV